MNFNDDGSNWEVIKVIPQENSLFKWDLIIAKWSGRGVMPLWHKEERRFFSNRIRKEDGAILIPSKI